MTKHNRTIEEIIKEANLKHNSLYSYVDIPDTKWTTKISILCTKHGEFQQTINHHLQGQGCPRCGGTFKKTTDQFIEEAIKIHGLKYDYSKSNYHSYKQNLTIICPNHGGFEQSPSAHLFQGQGCPRCGGTFKKTTDQFIEEAIKIHGLKYDYSKSNYANNKEKVTIVCDVHGDFEQSPSSHINKKSGCRSCNVLGGYSKQYFIKNPDQKELLGKLYIIEITDSTGCVFYKLGMTKNTVEERFRYNKTLSIQTIIYFEKPLYEVFLIEQKMLNYKTKHLGTPKGINIGGGETECFTATVDELNLFIDKISNYFKVA